MSVVRDRAASARADAALRRALLVADRDHAQVQDQIDAAEMALEADQPDLAAAMYGAVALQRGRTPDTAAMLGEVNARAGLWHQLPDVAATGTGGFAFDVAVAELRALLPCAPKLAAIAPGPEVALPDDGAPSAAAPGLPGDAAELAERACELATSAPEADPHATADGLRAIAGALAKLSRVRLDHHVDLPTARLGRLFVLERLRRFTAANSDLLLAKPGELFVRAAALRQGALGPYFSGVSLLIRSARDIFALIDAAHDGAAGDDATATWCTLLAAHLRHHQVNELIQELGDRGMTAALRAVLTGLTRSGPQAYWHDAVQAVRDAFLDLGDMGSAALAQQVNVQRHPISALEWTRLGEIQAAAGERDGADRAYRRALFLAPESAVARSGLEQVRADTAVTIPGGYGTPPGRRLLRRARSERIKDKA